eukprot:TRINITY_DN16764_c0_g2_i5.p1 TRINITY_DN16764_c0_g2~~TRINITY_DN16764_c0_g2_i5.p1  ORF type:complete len:290 (+),score=37.56 TRINITY_DN16764_c0_g2_i5:59-871(+)
MVTAARLGWLRQQIADGRRYRMSTNGHSSRTVVHVTLWEVCDACASSLVGCAMVDALTDLSSVSVVVDRGHVVSNGSSKVALVIRSPRVDVDTMVAPPHGIQAEHGGHGVSTPIDGTGFSAPVRGALGLRRVPVPLLQSKEEPEEKNERVDHVATRALLVHMDTASSTIVASRLAGGIRGVASEDEFGAASMQAAPSQAVRPAVSRRFFGCSQWLAPTHQSPSAAAASTRSHVGDNYSGNLARVSRRVRLLGQQFGPSPQLKALGLQRGR